MRVIEADVLFSILDDRIKEAEEDTRHAKRDVVAERADAVLSTLESLKADIEDNAPIVDAEPVKHGRWIGTGRTSVTCSECGEWTEVAGNYCPNCGARMDGDGE